MSLPESRDRYTAISYCAGDPQKTRELRIDGKSFNAFANLAHAIEETYRHCRGTSGNEEPMIWADQICINQSDLLERSHQVSFMQKVYENACAVTVCLSTDEMRGGSAIPWMKEAYAKIPQSRLSHQQVGLPERDCPFKSWYLSLLADEGLEHIWKDVLQVFEQPWWTRVCQEYLAARDTTFIYGGHSVCEVVFMDVAFGLLDSRNNIFSFMQERDKLPDRFTTTAMYQWLCQIYDSLQFFRRYKVRPALLLDFKIRYLKDPLRHGQLPGLLCYSSARKASDRRDYVYAFLSLANKDYGIKVVYSPRTTYEYVCIETARKIIEQDGLDVLYLKGFSYNKSLPSWVPDWSSTHKNGVIHHLLYTDAPRWRGDTTNTVFVEDGRILEISGLIVDTLEHLSHERAKQYGYECSLNRRRYKVETSNEAQVGDQVWLLYGAKGPFVLRPTGSSFKLIDNASVQDEVGGSGIWTQHYTALKQQTPRRIRII
ncbi:hypothetical protein EK21DRAFT_114062 [Setomelanomma holmii]|uniref:Heterokaryon incompatibility domain-containing protein n=1 Tax=Setomelanomma holmii TaxID=210430 RepID=A0A9P4H665_9PLEO|nr:hypothetical protein EK21DRAFT_114062 [Setomelanomma holmii]